MHAAKTVSSCFAVFRHLRSIQRSVRSSPAVTCRGIDADEDRLWQHHIGRTACRSAWQAAVGAEYSCATNLPTSEVQSCVTVAQGTALPASARVYHFPVGSSCVTTTSCRVTSPPSSTRRAMLVAGSIYARCRQPCSMFLAPNTWPSVAVCSVQLLLVCGTVCQCRLLSNWTFFDAAWKLNCSSVLTTDTAPVKQLYCCMTHFPFPAAFCCGRNLEVYRL